MALPHLHSGYTSRKNVYEAAIVRRRDLENDMRERFTERATNFQRYDVQAAKEKDWTSDKAFNDSMDAYKAKLQKDSKKETLDRRKKRLAQLLEGENQQYEAQLRRVSPDNYQRLMAMKGRAEYLKSAREDKRKELAEELLYEQFRQNNPDLRRVEREQLQEEVVKKWEDQIEEKEEVAAADRIESLVYDEAFEEQRRVDIEDEEEMFKRRIKEERSVQDVLRRQIDEIKDREDEAEELRRREARLEHERIELEEMESERRQMEDDRKKREHGRALLRQHTAALRRRSKMVQEDLEADIRFLAALEDRERSDDQVKTARRQRAKADAEDMRAMVEDQLRLERAREAELDDLFQEEAAKLWTKREAEWEKERVARERLMKEVMEERQRQVDDQLDFNRQRQEESIQAREDLIRDLELGRQATRREEAQAKMERQRHRADLESQMTSRQERKADERRRTERELVEEKKGEEAYEELLRKEVERMRMRGYQPKSARKSARHP